MPPAYLLPSATTFLPGVGTGTSAYAPFSLPSSLPCRLCLQGGRRREMLPAYACLLPPLCLPHLPGSIYLYREGQERTERTWRKEEREGEEEGRPPAKPAVWFIYETYLFFLCLPAPITFYTTLGSPACHLYCPCLCLPAFYTPPTYCPLVPHHTYLRAGSGRQWWRMEGDLVEAGVVCPILISPLLPLPISCLPVCLTTFCTHGTGGQGQDG